MGAVAGIRVDRSILRVQTVARNNFVGMFLAAGGWVVLLVVFPVFADVVVAGFTMRAFTGSWVDRLVFDFGLPKRKTLATQEKFDQFPAPSPAPPARLPAALPSKNDCRRKHNCHSCVFDTCYLHLSLHRGLLSPWLGGEGGEGRWEGGVRGTLSSSLLFEIPLSK